MKDDSIRNIGDRFPLNACGNDKLERTWKGGGVPNALSKGTKIIASASQASVLVGLLKNLALLLLKVWVLLKSEESHPPYHYIIMLRVQIQMMRAKV